MEFLFELLFEIVFEGSLELGTYRKVPMPLRILALLVFAAIWIGITGVIFYVGYGVMKGGNIAAAVLFYVVAVGLLVGGVYAIIKKYRENNTEE